MQFKKGGKKRTFRDRIIYLNHDSSKQTIYQEQEGLFLMYLYRRTNKHA